jgi:4'-phosphopantetheinyl transferase EntD
MAPRLGRSLRSDAPLAELLPADVWVEESVVDVDEPLLEGEAEAVRRAVPGRLAEYVTGRALARRALAHYGVPPQPLLAGQQGEPRWPHGFVGSITHCVGYRAVAVARSDRVRGLGVDAERRTVLTCSETSVVTTADERRRALDSHLPPEWSLHVFCAKEAAFKAVGDWLDEPTNLTDIEVELHTQTFMATVGEQRLLGGWGTNDSHVFAAVVLRH